MSTGLRIATMTFGMALATGAYAAAAPSPEVVAALDKAQRPVEELVELEEIWVRGKLLSQVIEDAEDDFFLLYNKLNRNNQYDIECGMMQLESGSMIMIRKCIPGFIVYNYGNYINDTGRTVISYGLGCTGDYDESMRSWNRTGLASYTCPNAPTGGTFIQPPPELMLMEKRKDYAANVIEVINSDRRLVEKMWGLDGLYKQMQVVQGRYVQVKGVPEPAPRKARKAVKASTGPRVF